MKLQEIMRKPALTVYILSLHENLFTMWYLFSSSGNLIQRDM